MSRLAWLRLPWRCNRRVGVALSWAPLVLGMAVAVNISGIHVLGSINGWEHWLRAHAGYFFVWRLCLYVATVCSWCSMRRRLRQREPSDETHQRLLRVEIAVVTAIVLLEGSQWLQR